MFLAISEPIGARTIPLTVAGGHRCIRAEDVLLYTALRATSAGRGRPH